MSEKFGTHSWQRSVIINNFLNRLFRFCSKYSTCNYLLLRNRFKLKVPQYSFCTIWNVTRYQSIFIYKTRDCFSLRYYLILHSRTLTTHLSQARELHACTTTYKQKYTFI